MASKNGRTRSEGVFGEPRFAGGGWQLGGGLLVKHLPPGDFMERLLVRPELLQHGNLLHCRPFNGHHCQIPVTDGEGNLTREFRDYLPFAEAAFSRWLDGPRPHNELWVVPELGPVSSGYGISTWPSVWEDCQVARCELQEAWDRALSGRSNLVEPTPGAGMD